MEKNPTNMHVYLQKRFAKLAENFNLRNPYMAFPTNKVNKRLINGLYGTLYISHR
jgi:hypothetical protein